MQKNRTNRSSDPRLNNMSPNERARYEAYVRERRAEAARRAEVRKQREKAQREKQRKENMKIFKGRLLVFAVVLVLLAAVVFGVFMFFFHRTPDAPHESGKIKYFYGGSEKRSEPASDVITSHGIYFCFNDLSDYLGMAESGSASEMKFILPSDDSALSADGTGREEYIVFYTGGGKVNINGQEITLDIPSFTKKDEVWVSLTFAEKYLNNLAVSYNERSGAVSVARIKDEELSTAKDTVYKDVSFRLKSAREELRVDEDPLIGDVIYTDGGEYSLDFNADLSEYEQYMNPTDDKRDAFLVLVNAANPLTEHDIPNDLNDVTHTSAARKTQQLRLYAAKALEALFKEMISLEYYNMSVFSGYVSYSYQDTLFAQYTANEMAANPNLTKAQAEQLVLTYYSRPGTSDHQTGLSVDMDTMGAYTTDFCYTEEYEWLSENAWKFGFILRYPDDKTDITGMAFEPWHYRYVGRYHALKIHESGLCLEEYLKEIRK